jgi:hypothetical protein
MRWGYFTTDGHSVSQSVLVSSTLVGLATRYYFLSEYCRSRSYFTTDSQSVTQSVLVSSTLVGLATRYYFLSECCCLKFAVLFVWGALSDERPGLSFVSHSLVIWSKFKVTLQLTVTQSASMSRFRAHFVDVWPDIASFSRVLVWNLLFCLCGAPSLTRGRVWPPLWVRVTLRLTVSMCRFRAQFVDVWPDIASLSRVWDWNLLSCLYGAPSLTRGRVCPL